jgi:hypothetical protein
LEEDRKEMFERCETEAPADFGRDSYRSMKEGMHVCSSDHRKIGQVEEIVEGSNGGPRYFTVGGEAEVGAKTRIPLDAVCGLNHDSVFVHCAADDCGHLHREDRQMEGERAPSLVLMEGESESYWERGSEVEETSATQNLSDEYERQRPSDDIVSADSMHDELPYVASGRTVSQPESFDRGLAAENLGEPMSRGRTGYVPPSDEYNDYGEPVTPGCCRQEADIEYVAEDIREKNDPEELAPLRSSEPSDEE